VLPPVPALFQRSFSKDPIVSFFTSGILAALQKAAGAGARTGAPYLPDLNSDRLK
jgi:hypothetical protein